MFSGKKIGVGIIGLSATGGWAATAHVPALRSLPEDFEIVGLSASSKATAKAAADKFEVPFYTDSPAELAARPDVDLVVVTVKVPYHRELVEAALGAGKMVYCEWPLGNGLEEAIGLADSAKSRGIKTFVGLQARSAPPVRFLRDLIADGYIGEVISTSMIASAGPPWGGVATSGTAYVNDRSTGATMVTIPFGHTMDAFCWILGDFADCAATLAIRRPEVAISDTGATIRATAPDQVAIAGILESGAIAAIHFRGGMSNGTNFLWELNGTKGDLVITGPIGHLQYGMVRIQAGIGEGAELTDLAVPERYIAAQGNPGGYHYTVAQAYGNLLDDLRNGTAHIPDFGEALSAHRLLDRIDRQMV